MVDIASLGLKVNTDDLQRGVAALEQFGRQAKQTGDETKHAHDSLEEFGNVAREAKSIILELGSIIGVSLSAEKIFQMAEAWEHLSIGIRNFSSSSQEATKIMDDLVELSERSHTSLVGNAEVMQRLLIVNRELNVSTNELEGFTEALASSMQLMGRGSEEAASMVGFLSRALQQGTLDGRMMRSIMTEMPILAQEMAKHIEGAAGSVDILQKRMKDGAITSRDFVDAIAESLPEMQRRVAESGNEVSEAVTDLGTSMTAYFGNLNEAIQGTNLFQVAVHNLRAEFDALRGGLKDGGAGKSDFWDFLSGMAPTDYSAPQYQSNLRDKLTGHTADDNMAAIVNNLDLSYSGLDKTMDHLKHTQEALDQVIDDSKKKHEQDIIVVDDLTHSLQEKLKVDTLILEGYPRQAKLEETLDGLREQGIELTGQQIEKIKQLIYQQDLLNRVKQAYADIEQQGAIAMDKISDSINTQIKLSPEGEDKFGHMGKAAYDTMQEIGKIGVDVSNQFSDTFFAMIDGQKGAWDGLKNYVVDVLKQMAAAAIFNPIIQPIIMSMGGSLMGAAASGLSSGMLGASGLGGLLGGGLAGGLDSIGMSSGLFGGGAIDMSAMGMGQVGIGSGLLGGSASLTGVLGAGGLGALGGGLLASALGMHKTGGSIGGGIGATIGMMTPLGPIGALIGGALGSLVGGLFGPGPSDALEGLRYDLGTGASSSVNLGANKRDAGNQQSAQSIVSAVSGFYKTLQGFGLTPGVSDLGVDVGSRSGIVGSIGNFSGTFSTPEEAFKALSQQLIGSLTDIPEQFQSIIDNIDWSNLDKFAKDMADAADKAARLDAFHTALGGVKDQIEQIQNPEQYAYDMLDRQFKPLKDAATEFGEDMTDIDTLYNLKRKQIYEQFHRDEIDLTVQTTDTIISNAEEAKKELLDMADTYSQVMLKAMDKQIEAANNQLQDTSRIAQAWQQISTSTRGTISSLILDPNLSTLSPQGRRDEAFSELMEAYSRYKAGDQSAATDIQNLARQALTASREVNASSTAYVQDQRQVMDILSGTKTFADQQVELLTTQLTVLTQIRDNLVVQRGYIPGGSAATTATSVAQIQGLSSSYGQAQRNAAASGVSEADFYSSSVGQGYETALLGMISGVNDTDWLASDFNRQGGRLNDPIYGGSASRIRDAESAKLRALGVPGFASGGSSAGGLAMVGEMQAEVLRLPGGSSVSPPSVDMSPMTSRQGLTINAIVNGFTEMVKRIDVTNMRLENLTRKVMQIGTVQ